MSTIWHRRREHLPAQPRLTVVEGTISDKRLVDALIGDFKPDILVHAAASYKDPDDWYHEVVTNSVGGVNLVPLPR